MSLSAGAKPFRAGAMYLDENRLASGFGLWYTKDDQRPTPSCVHRLPSWKTKSCKRCGRPNPVPWKQSTRLFSRSHDLKEISSRSIAAEVSGLGTPADGGV
jgi:hypothetical protein